MPKRPPSPPSFTPPLPSDQHLVVLSSPQGSNNWLCKDTKDVERLVEVSSKLRRIKSLIIMRGDFAIISLWPQSSEEKGGRLVGEILHILDKSDIKEWKKAGAWPEGLGETPTPAQAIRQSDSEEEEYASEGEGEDEDDDESRSQ
ncbi:uncharacterized protein L201_001176 [Kwoniella dendrophila CBS 6074]|uniref:S1-like domain-containing protein n=1 Tax=Kwoniella dendrophila CBS 6074 TaxID=1295534 RepID=A0AAX4JN61_9TREE